MIVVVDYQCGNNGSVVNMLRKVGARAVSSSDPKQIASADKLVLPGVGAFRRAVENIQRLNLGDLLNEKVRDQRTPILGICLGMQLFTRGSEEGDAEGFGWLAADTVRFRFDAEYGKLRLPHMGWNTVSVKESCPMAPNIDSEARFYFVHSYHVKCERSEDAAATTTHGYPFVSMVHCGNIVGTQFHPEKSHFYGMKVMKSFATEISNAAA